jgi:Double zinc ribbon/Putative prokaryotic signal transducing protein
MPEKGMCMQCGSLIAPSDEGIKLCGQICFDCGHESDSPFDTCPECGSPAGVACAECGAVNSVAADNCDQCGIPVRSPKSIADIPDTAQPLSPGFSLYSMRPRFAGNPFKVIVFALTAAVCISIFAFLNGEKTRTNSFLIFGLCVLPFMIFFAFLYFRKPSINASATGSKRSYSLKKEGGLVEVFTSINPHQAEYVKELLKNEGLMAMILGSHWGGFYPFANPRGVQVLVRKDQMEKALELISAYSIPNGNYDKKTGAGNQEGLL